MRPTPITRAQSLSACIQVKTYSLD
jgi:hypothetical protein